MTSTLAAGLGDVISFADFWDLLPLVTLSLLAALIMGVLRNGLNLLGVSSFLQQIVIGAVIVVAVLLDTILKRRNRT